MTKFHQPTINIDDKPTIKYLFYKLKSLPLKVFFKVKCKILWAIYGG